MGKLECLWKFPKNHAKKVLLSKYPCLSLLNLNSNFGYSNFFHDPLKDF